jgi:type I restriction-modification system DNA methylase subunit
MSKNEKKTENLARKLLIKADIFDNENYIVEEQKSDNPIIQKLLKNASKSGAGLGKPEFIIRKKDDNDFLMIIECKADTKYHESNNRDLYTDYAVDGALLYGSHLSREFNVIAIGISGENEDDSKISTYLYPKNSSSYTNLLDENNQKIEKILNWDRYIERAKFDPALAKARHVDLMKFSRELHDYMRDYAKITEAQKPLLVSGVLLALMDRGFEVAYRKYEGEELASETFNSIQKIIEKAELGDSHETKKKAVINAFSFIAHHPELHKVDAKKNESPLLHIIRDLHVHVQPFTRDHYDFDIIGNFYGEFIRYTGGDGKGLGIVLTPKHITDLFADIAKVNKNSVVLDICAGTAGFLISAMKKMTQNVDADEKRRILENSLIGVEQSPEMFALAVSNMILRGDGKTNLYQGDSLRDQNIIEKIKEKADTGFINPPYSQKGEDVSEWHFIIQMLDLLKTRGTGIAIVPMQLAIDTKNLLREKLLKNHRLEAVMSMPDDLFYPIGVVTCIMVFTAHVPHDSDIHHESWFGYWKDDGFKKDRTQGRIPKNEELWKTIKNEWLVNFSNKKEIPGKSIRKKINQTDEWCVEAYLETDYTNLSDQEFIERGRKYLAFLIMNGDFALIKEFSKNDQRIGLHPEQSNWFTYEDLFEVNIGKSIDLNKLEASGNGINYVGRTEENNGITAKVINDGSFEIYQDGCITVPMVGNELKSSYQTEPFCVSQNIAILKPKKFTLNPFIAIFLNTIIRKDRFRFAYGRTLSLDRLKMLKIKLPVDKNGNPNWKFMEDYIKSLPYSASI